MNKILLIIMLFVSLISFGQKRRDGNGFIEFISKKIKHEVIYVSYKSENNFHKVDFIQYHDSFQNKYVELNEVEIEQNFPELINGFVFNPTENEIDTVKDRKRKEKNKIKN